MTLVLVSCLSLARVIPPPPNRREKMRELDEAVKEGNVASFNNAVDLITGRQSKPCAFVV
jgi:hypothetical protein